ncbi:MAG TPA: hypothetical protein VFS43_09310 [Polyangiaceae bacterium]|nr:hypothetical protein [Polyangiaceae bacterium]
MSVSNVPSNPPTVPLYNTTGVGISGALAMRTMSPEDIMNYVRSQLGSIDGQMADYKTDVEARQKKADELREAMSLLREMKQGDGSIQGHFPEEKYNRLMTLLGKNSGDPSARAAYETLLDSYGGYHATEDFSLPGPNGNTLIERGQQQGNMAGADRDPYLRTPDGTPQLDANGQPVVNPNRGQDDQDCILDPTETQGVMDNVKQALESINSDNEMVMMELQKLMQQRNQITQFASNAMNLDNETKKSVIGNIR